LTLWQLGIEAQEITSSIAHLADQLASDDDSTRASAITDLEATLLAEERTKECPASTPLADSRQSSWPVSAPRLSLATTWGRRHEN
jgi:hypothetical protein